MANGIAKGAIKVRKNHVYGMSNAVERYGDKEEKAMKIQKPKFMAIYSTIYRHEGGNNIQTEWFVNELELRRWLENPYGADVSSIRVIEIKREIPLTVKLTLGEKENE